MIGRTISQYRIVAELGRGGMGVVYEAEDVRLHRRVAIKVLPALLSNDEKTRKRFELEARAASALDHPNICTIHEIGDTDDGELFIAMSLYDGQTLDAVLAQGPVEQTKAIDIARQVVDGLHASHRSGIVHRDVKPGNIMVTDSGRVVVLDFGLAKVEDINVTAEGETVGTVAYMSPEQARGNDVDERTDIWSLGIVLYELFSGVKPFDGSYSQAVLYTILNEEPVPLSERAPDVPAEICTVVERCLRKQPDERFRSLEEVSAVLHRLAYGAAPDAVSSKRRARPVTVAAVVAAALIALVLIVPSFRSAIFRSIGAGALPAERHVVVLAAAREGENADAAALKSGLVRTAVESLTSAGKDERDFWVVPIDRVQSFNVTNVEEARSALGVNLALLLDVQSDGSDLRLTLDLVDAADRRTIQRRAYVQPASESNAMQADLLQGLGEILEMEIAPQVRRNFASALSSRPGASDFYTRGMGYLQQYREGNNLDASIILFRRAVLTDSTYARAYAGLCEATWRKFEDSENTGLVSEAEGYCEHALELDANLTSAYVTMGRLHTGTGRYGTALGEFQLALSRDSTDSRAALGMAAAYEALGRMDDAEAMYRHAIAQQPDFWGGYRDLGVFYFNQARYEEAIDQFLIVADLNPFNARAYSNIGAIYFYLDRRQEAIEMFKLALQIEEDHTVYSNLATLYYYEGQYAEAAEAFEASLRLGDDNPYDTWGYLATAYEWSGQPEKAHEAHVRAAELAEERLAVNPRDQEVLGHLASYYAYLGEREKALGILDRLASMNPADPQDLSRMGEAYEKLGMRPEAIQWTEKALDGGYALAEIVDYPGFKDLLSDPDFQAVLERYQTESASEALTIPDN
jgi:tetratricopeptide (TPR) repeat protein